MGARKQAESFVKAPPWLALGFPALALVTLIWVEAAGLDRQGFDFFNSLAPLTGPALWAHLTILGDGLVCAVLFLPWIRSRPERVWGGILGALLMVVTLRTFKAVLSLPRPLGVLPEEAVYLIGPGHRRSAFPSGHTATAFLFFGIWALSVRRWWSSAALVLAAALVGVSRMAVGVHWPSDVLAGAALGWISAWIGLRMAHRTPWGMGLTGQRILGVLLLICALVLLLLDHTGYPGVLLFQRSLAGLGLLWGGRELVRLADPSEISGFGPGNTGN